MLDIAQPTLENENLQDFLAETQIVEGPDYASFNKEDFQKLFEKYPKDSDLQEQFNLFKRIKPYINELSEGEKNVALDKFISEGGAVDDFEYRFDPFYEKFETHFSKLKQNVVQIQKDIQFKKGNSLKTKNEILDQMRALIDSGASGKSAFENFKKLQLDWKNAGPVPSENVQQLWSNFHAIVNRFYDQRSIAFELLDLDRKRNLQAKLILCEKAEKLAEEPSIKKALKDLEDLHEEFRHIGPVPKEQQDEIWNRVKEASNKVHEKKREYLDELKSKFDINLKSKFSIIDRIEKIAGFSSEKPEEWINVTKELESIQTEWKNAGLIDKDKVKDVNKKYWDGLKKFYNEKRTFFKELERVKSENLRLKTELCVKAETLSQSAEWDSATKEVIELQKQWKTVGHVPLKMKDKIYDRFKRACDAYFESKRGVLRQTQNLSKQHLKERYDFIERIEKEGIKSSEELTAKLEKWKSLIEVSGNEATKAYNKFTDALRSGIKDVAGIDTIEKDAIISRLMVEGLKASPDGVKELMLKEKKYRKEIRDIEDNIAQFKNNMEFFARSKNAESIRVEFTNKIEEEQKRMALAKSRLRILLNN